MTIHKKRIKKYAAAIDEAPFDFALMDPDLPAHKSWHHEAHAVLAVADEEIAQATEDANERARQVEVESQQVIDSLRTDAEQWEALAWQTLDLLTKATAELDHYRGLIHGVANGNGTFTTQINGVLISKCDEYGMTDVHVRLKETQEDRDDAVARLDRMEAALIAIDRLCSVAERDGRTVMGQPFILTPQTRALLAKAYE